MKEAELLNIQVYSLSHTKEKNFILCILVLLSVYNLRGDYIHMLQNILCVQQTVTFGNIEDNIQNNSKTVDSIHTFISCCYNTHQGYMFDRIILMNMSDKGTGCLKSNL